jgi:hypothetical protein
MRKQVLISIQEFDLEMFDAEAKKCRLTRSAYIRKLVVQDVRRQADANQSQDAKPKDHGVG